MSEKRPQERLLASNIHFSRGSREVLRGTSLSLASGEVVSLLGGNGAGKTTLLRIMLGLTSPSCGEVTLNAIPLRALPRRALAERLAYVPQSHQPPFPYLVREVVSLGRYPALGLFGKIRRHDVEVVDTVLEQLCITHLANRPYTQLSGGERQLVMIGRAMAQGASLLILDEPLSGLDYGHQVRMLQNLRDLAGQGYGILMTTHHPDQALMVSSRVVTLINGRIGQDGLPQTVVTSECIFELYGVYPHDN